MRKRYGFWNFVLDFFLICITGGLWGVWLILKFIRRNS